MRMHNKSKTVKRFSPSPIVLDLVATIVVGPARRSTLVHAGAGHRQPAE